MRPSAFLSAFLLPLTVVSGGTYFVSVTGDDSGPGTQAQPWKTISRAAQQAGPGDIVEVGGGVYSEFVRFHLSGTADAPLVFRAKPGETPVLDGTNLTIGKGWQPFFWLHNVSHLQIEGFELRNLRTANRGRVPIGILVTGSGTGVRIAGNHVHRLGTDYSGRDGGDAHGIAVYGDSTIPISDLTIHGNTLENLSLGSSEALVLNGNVAGFIVEANTVRSCNNIGIDAIGHEGTCPDPTEDQARLGVIRGNTVLNISSYGNPAYGPHYSAGGIYVDGGRDILIERNTVTECDIGIELASEHAGKATSRVHVRNNLIFKNRIGGIFLGGYDTARGRTEECNIEHNSFFANDSLQHGNGEIHFQFDVRDSKFRHNIVFANNQGLILGNIHQENSGNSFDYNLFHTSGLPRWQWKNVVFSGWETWKTGTGQDSHSILADPLWENPDSGSFSLLPNSPAIEAGDPTFVASPGERDHSGRPRLNDLRTDIGAIEFDLARFSGGNREFTAPSLVWVNPLRNQVRLSIRRRSDWSAHGLIYEVQTSPTLASGSWVVHRNVAQPPPVAFPDRTEQADFVFDPPPVNRWFARIRVRTSHATEQPD